MVSCRKCENCRANRFRSWCGRLLAEAQTNKDAWFITLTYAGGYENSDAYVLNYDDVTRMFKRLRRAGYQFRYVIKGEFGDKRRRAHWHALIYWKSEPPKIEAFDKDIRWQYWPEYIQGRPTNYGHARIEKPRSQQASAAYILKYLDKEPDALTDLRFSKVPALGRDYLMQYARRHAREGLALFRNGPRYTIPGNVNKNGKLFWYTVRPSNPLYTEMLRAYLNEWASCRFKQKIPFSETVYDFLDEMTQGDVKLPFVTSAFMQKHFEMTWTAPPDKRLEVETLEVDYTDWVLTTFHNHGNRLRKAEAYSDLGQVKETIWLKGPDEEADLNRLLLSRTNQHARRLDVARQSKIVGVNCSALRSRSSAPKTPIHHGEKPQNSASGNPSPRSRPLKPQQAPHKNEATQQNRTTQHDKGVRNARLVHQTSASLDPGPNGGREQVPKGGG